MRGLPLRQPWLQYRSDRTDLAVDRIASYTPQPSAMLPKASVLLQGT